MYVPLCLIRQKEEAWWRNRYKSEGELSVVRSEVGGVIRVALKAATASAGFMPPVSSGLCIIV